MISRKCFISYFWLIVTINMVHYSICQAKAVTGDRYEREITTTVVPETTESDMQLIIPTVDPNHPCSVFTNVDYKKKEFFSPGYPNKTYANNSNCDLVLQAPKGHLLRLDFRDLFHIEESAECKNDFLEVRDGKHGYNNYLLKPFCGNNFPPVLTSSDRHLWIHFKSDENIEYGGFRAVFEYVKRSESLQTPEAMDCRIESYGNEQGILQKEDIPPEILKFNTKNRMPIDCLWVIIVREKWKIQLQFEKFSLEKANDCDSNFLEIFSDKTDMPNLVKNFCGSIADTVASKHNIMFIRFYVDATITSSTFKANYTAYRENDKDTESYIENCASDEFDCEDATCISSELKCNGLYNCRFRWDEDDCHGTPSLAFSDDHIIIIMVIFSLILSGMCFTFIFNCIKKLIRDHHTIQEYIRQSREQQLNELDKQEQVDKKLSKVGSRSRSNSSPSTDSHRFDVANAVNTPCYVPGGELLPILIRNEHSMSPSNGDAYNQNIYTVDNENMPEMCDSACQTRESLFTTQAYSSGNSTPNHSIHTNSPPAPFSTFGYKKDNNKFKAEAKIEVAPQKSYFDDKRRPYSVQTTKSAPDVIVTH